MQPDLPEHGRVAGVRPDGRGRRAGTAGRAGPGHSGTRCSRRVGAEVRVVAIRAERQRCAARPPSDDLGGEQLLLVLRASAGPDALPEGPDAGVELAEHDVGTVAAEDVRIGQRGDGARLVGVAEDELARPQRRLVRVGPRHAAPLDRGSLMPSLNPNDVRPFGSMYTSCHQMSATRAEGAAGTVRDGHPASPRRARARPAPPGSRGRREVGERGARGHGRVVDAVGHPGPVARDEQRVEGVHRVLVERAGAARRVRPPVEHGALDLQEAVVAVRSPDVDHEVVGQEQLGQRVRSVGGEGPIGLVVEPVEDGGNSTLSWISGWPSRW